MSQRLSNSFVNTNRPGAYFNTSVKSQPIGIASSGNIAIIGEAAGGDDFSAEALKDNFFTPDQIDSVTKKYVSGPIIDAFRALASSSNDANITGSANRIYIVKTNAGSKAQATVASAYGTLSAKIAGVDGNKFNYLITNSADEEGAAINGATIASLGAALDSKSFSVRLNGGAAVVVTLSATSTDHDTIAELAAEIAAQLPAGLTCVVGAAADSLLIKTDVDAAANSKGFGKSFELIDSSGDLADFGLSEGLSISSQEPEVQVDIKRADVNVNESLLAKAEVAMLIGYEGTTASLTISASNVLTTSVVGGVGANLSINLSEFSTLKDLADFINSQAGYSCSVISTAAQNPATVLDKVTAAGICSTGSLVKAGRIKKAASNFAKKLAESANLDFSATATAGLPDEMASLVYLSGGAKGATTAANFVSAVDALEGVDVNFIIPLFSRNAADDIAEGLTESLSTYSIDAVHAAVKSHVLKMSVAKIKKHRQAFLSYWGTFSNAKSKAGSLANARVSLSFQKASSVNSAGEIVSFLPWYSACIAAGMQAAGFYKAIVNKLANVISYEDPTDFDSGSPGDIEEAIDAGLLFLEKDIAGNKWVSDQTTYGVDTNFVYNSIQAMYAADLVSLDLAASFQRAFVGQSLADVDASTGISFLASKMDGYKKNKLIAGSSDAPLGWKNAKISINGPIMEVQVEIKLASAIYFIPISIQISQVTNTAQA
jgi:hypothetical protein